MAAEFDTQSNYTGEDEPIPQPAPPRNRDGGIWGGLALLVLGVVIVAVLVTQLTAKVPNTVGMSRADAEIKLKKAGFVIGEVSEVPAISQKIGAVQEQAPVAGTTVRKGASVDLMVALGAELAKVPDVRGHDSANASVEIMQAGFEISSAEEYNDTVPQGAAISQSPAAGSLAAPGSTVTVYYSIGAQSAAAVSVSHNDTSGVAAYAGDGTTGRATSTQAINARLSYPGVTAWSSGGDIYARLTPGGSVRQLTSNGDYDSDPIVSPGENYVVFTRAPGSGDDATGIGAVSLTTFEIHMLSVLGITGDSEMHLTCGKPVFAPSEGSTTPNTDWIVFPQFFTQSHGEDAAPGARLIVCNVLEDSSWVSWNNGLRSAATVSVGVSDRAGCVRVVNKRGSKTLYSRNFNPSTGLYLP